MLSNVTFSIEDRMRRFRIGLLTQDDIKTIHTRFIGNSNITLPPITQIRCACYTDAERNAYSNVVFIHHLKPHMKKQAITMLSFQTILVS